MRVRSAVAALTLLAWASAPPAAAQSRRSPAPARGFARIEISGGAGLFGGLAVAEADAALRANGAQPSPYRVFSSSNRLAAAPFGEARLAYRLTRALDVEARLTYGRPTLEATIANDAENAAGVVASVAGSEYTIDGGVLVRLARWSFGRTVPFAAGGAGYTRYVYADRTLIEHGTEYYAGGGVRRALRSRPQSSLEQIGVRAEARLHVLSGGVIASGTAARVSVGASLFAAF